MTDVRHATTDELLALRDGEAGAWTTAHVETCTPCAMELYRLDQVRARLKALPGYAPPRDRWPLIAARAQRERRQRRMRGAIGIATAAALAALTFLALEPGTGVPLAAQQAELSRAMVRSQVLEAQLQALRPERRALGAEAARAAAELEERLSDVDARLGDPGQWRDEPGQVADLWMERASLLSALVEVHTTRVAAVGL